MAYITPYHVKRWERRGFEKSIPCGNFVSFNWFKWPIMFVLTSETSIWEKLYVIKTYILLLISYLISGAVLKELYQSYEFINCV